MARCKASFTDALIHELESSGHNSPAFDRLIQLRGAWNMRHLIQDVYSVSAGRRFGQPIKGEGFQRLNN